MPLSDQSVDRSTEMKIIEAARSVFQRRGFSGARMQEIADEAGINKALLHYYFRSKDKLFDMVITEATQRIFAPLTEIWTSQDPLMEKISRFVYHYVQTMIDNPFIPSFVVSELGQNPEKIQLILRSKTPPPKAIVFAQIEEAVAQGIIRPISPHDLMINIVSMCLFPFIAKRLFQGVMHKSDAEYAEMMRQRPQVIVDFVMNAIKP